MKLGENCACLDTTIHGPELVERLEKLKLVKCMGNYIVRGVYQCPLFVLDMEKLKQYCIPTDAKNCA